MKTQVKYSPSYSMLVVDLEAGEQITGEAGAMSYMSPTLEIRTRKREQSLLGTLATSLIGGQSFFVNDFVASAGPGEIGLVAAPIGDIQQMPIAPGRGYIIQKSSYIASSQQVDLDVKWEGFTKGLFGQGLFMIKVTGRGDLWINTFGAIDKHTLAAGEELVVDNFHLVAFSDSCQYSVYKVGGWKETFFSGEGLVTRIRGPGEVFLQTKNLREFTDWLWTLIGPRVQTRAR